MIIPTAGGVGRAGASQGPRKAEGEGWTRREERGIHMHPLCSGAETLGLMWLYPSTVLVGVPNSRGRGTCR